MKVHGGIKVRPALPEEIPIVVAFVERLTCEQSRKALTLDQESMSRAAREIMDFDHHRIFLAFDGERPVGMAELVQSTAINTYGSFGVINEMYVEPDYRSLGVDAALIEAMAAHGAAEGWSHIEVGAPGGDYFASIVDSYLREGFVEIGPRLKMQFTK